MGTFVLRNNEFPASVGGSTLCTLSSTTSTRGWWSWILIQAPPTYANVWQPMWCMVRIKWNSHGCCEASLTLPGFVLLFQPGFFFSQASKNWPPLLPTDTNRPLHASVQQAQAMLRIFRFLLEHGKLEITLDVHRPAWTEQASDQVQLLVCFKMYLQCTKPFMKMLWSSSLHNVFIHPFVCRPKYFKLHMGKSIHQPWQSKRSWTKSNTCHQGLKENTHNEAIGRVWWSWQEYVCLYSTWEGVVVL